MTEDVRKLLGGYATGTLTEEERQQLFHAALEDQALFEALVDEQALADLMEDSAARAALLQAVENPAFSPAAVFGDWLSRPRSKVLVALGCVAIVGIAVQSSWERSNVPANAIKSPPVASVPAPADESSDEMIAKRKTVRPLPEPPRPSSEARTKEKSAVSATAGNAATPPPRPAAAVPAPKAEAMATTPPPPARQVADAESATRSLSTGGIDLQYTLLRRTPEGADVPVPASYPFSAADRVRLRVQANHDGTFEVRRNGAPMYTGAAAAGTPVVIPAELAFQDVAVHNITVRFAPMPSADVSSRMEFRDTRPAVAARVSAKPEPGVTAHIVLRRASE